MTDIKNTNTRLLLVEDDGVIVLHLKNILTRLGYDVVGLAATGEQALQMVEEMRPDLVLMDIKLAGKMTGIEAAAQIQAGYDIPVVYSTAYPDKMLWEEAKVTEPFGYLIKPFQGRELQITIEMALYRHKVEGQLKEYRDHLEELVEERTTELKQERDFNKLLIQSSPAFYVALNPDGTIMMMNDALLQTMGYTSDEMIGRDFLNDIPEREHDKLSKRFEALSKQHQPVVGENYLLTKDGREILTEWHSSLIFDTNDELDFVFGFGFDITERRAAEEELREYRDHLEKLVEERTAELTQANEQLQQEITERKQAEETLRESEERLRLGLLGLGAAIWDWDLQANRVYVSDLFLEMLGLTREEYGDDPAGGFNRVHPEDLPLVEQKTSDYLQRKIDRHTVEYRLQCKDGTYKWFLSHAVASWDEDGNPMRMIGSFIDTTERKRAEDALQGSEERFRTLIEGSPIAIGISRQGISTYVNQAFLHTFGYDNLSEVQDTPVLNYIAPHCHQEIIERVRRREQGQAVPDAYETTGQKKDGSQFFLYVQSCGLTLPNGPAVLGFFEDITERVQAKEQLKVALAEKVSLLKEVYHRVKNNLNVLTHLIEMQDEAVEVPEVHDALEVLQGRVKAMGLVHQKLYQAKNLAQINFGEYLEDMTNNLFYALAGDRPISLRVEAERIFVDAKLAIPCGLIVNELVTNALKYAFPKDQDLTGFSKPVRSEYEIRVAFESQDGEYVLTVSDNGVGLPPELDWRTTESLGLRLVNMWGTHQLAGSLKVESRDGTTFTMKFPE